MSQSGKPKVIVIAGPTSSGKTSLSVKLASALGGEVINADSMQVYRGMDIGTAKPTTEERKNIPHHLLDVVCPDEKFNAAIYRAMALSIIDDIDSRGKICFVVGGTGLYIKSLLGGLFRCPANDPALRESLHRECDLLGSENLHNRVHRLDPESADKIHPNDRIRIIRALEIIHLTGCLPSELSKEHGFGNQALKALKLYLKIDREKLYKYINERSRAMVEAGLVEETEGLLKRGYSPDLKPMKAIGYRHMVKHLKGGWSIEEAIKNLQIDTRRYAKRQLTWFRRDPEAYWIAPEDVDLAINKIKEFVSV